MGEEKDSQDRSKETWISPGDPTVMYTALACNIIKFWTVNNGGGGGEGGGGSMNKIWRQFTDKDSWIKRWITNDSLVHLGTNVGEG